VSGTERADVAALFYDSASRTLWVRVLAGIAHADIDWGS
jgi:hypothetical protein